MNFNQFNPQAATFSSGPLAGASIADLQKAMATSQTGRDFTGSNDPSNSYGPIKLEALDGTLKLLQYKEKDIRLWATIPKLEASNTVQEYAQLVKYGIHQSGFVSEGRIPAFSNDSQQLRKFVVLKYIAELREITHQATLMKTIVVDGIMQQETRNATLHLMKKIDSKLLTADSEVVPEEWDGIYKMHQKDSPISNMEAYYRNNPLVFDMRGQNLTESVFTEAADVLYNTGYSTPDTLFAPTGVLANFTKGFLTQKIFNPNTEQTSNAVVGQRVTSVDTQLGRVNLEYDLFMKGGAPISCVFASNGNLVYGPAPAPLAPNAPIINLPTGGPAGTGTTQFNDSLPNSWNVNAAFQTVYAIRAVNQNGESGVSTVPQGSAVTATSGHLATITPGVNGNVAYRLSVSQGTNPGTGYIVYRSIDNDPVVNSANFAANGGTVTLYPILYVPANTTAVSGYNPPVSTTAGLMPGQIRDSNFKIPNTQDCFLFENSKDIWGFYQLLPMFKVDLAQVTMTLPFVINLYGAPALFAPSKLLRFTNVI